MIQIVPYRAEYEKSWVYTKALSYLYSDFYDDPSRMKDQYSAEIYQDTVELVALAADQVVGLVDMAIFRTEIGAKNVYFPCQKLATFTNFAVHPDYQKQGIGWQLVQEALAVLRQKNCEALMIYTRGDQAANAFYSKLGAQIICESYRVRGTAKTEKAFRFSVNREAKRIVLREPESEEVVPYYLAEGSYVVPQKADLARIDIDESILERTYLVQLTEDSDV